MSSFQSDKGSVGCVNVSLVFPKGSDIEKLGTTDVGCCIQSSEDEGLSGLNYAKQLTHF